MEKTENSANILQQTQVRCPIMLVHGTWGRGFFPNGRLSKSVRRWFEEGSLFRIKLELTLREASLDWPIHSFLWSGANSVYARDLAAKRLADELRTCLRNTSDAVVVIAHSHGGNVALRAAHYLGSEATRIRLVTLATPFVRVFIDEGMPAEWQAMAKSLVILLLGPIWAILGAVSYTVLFLVTGMWPSNWIGISALLLVALSAMYPALLILKLLIEIILNPWPHTNNQRSALNLWPRLSSQLSERPRHIRDAAFYDTRGASTPLMLIVRGVDDEASLALAAGAIGSRISHYSIKSLLPMLWTLVILAVLVGATFAAIDGDTGRILFGVIPFAFGLVTLAILGLPGVFKSVFGREFLIGAIRCEIAADSVPDTAGRIETITLPLSQSWLKMSLRHGLYDHSKCVNEIVSWLRRVA